MDNLFRKHSAISTNVGMASGKVWLLQYTQRPSTQQINLTELQSTVPVGIKTKGGYCSQWEILKIQPTTHQMALVLASFLPINNQPVWMQQPPHNSGAMWQQQQVTNQHHWDEDKTKQKITINQWVDNIDFTTANASWWCNSSNRAGRCHRVNACGSHWSVGWLTNTGGMRTKWNGK